MKLKIYFRNGSFIILNNDYTEQSRSALYKKLQSSKFSTVEGHFINTSEVNYIHAQS